MLIPNKVVPPLSLPLVDGPTFDLHASAPRAMTMIAVYRGLHCPLCKTYLGDIEKNLDGFAELGVEAVAVTTDNNDRARQAKAEWELTRLPMAHSLAIETARSWGLYISSAIREAEPSLFAEPGLFLIRPDKTLYAASVQTMPFARPSISELHAALSFIIKNNYPARGDA